MSNTLNDKFRLKTLKSSDFWLNLIASAKVRAQNNWSNFEDAPKYYIELELNSLFIHFYKMDFSYTEVEDLSVSEELSQLNRLKSLIEADRKPMQKWAIGKES